MENHNLNTILTTTVVCMKSIRYMYIDKLTVTFQQCLIMLYIFHV